MSQVAGLEPKKTAAVLFLPLFYSLLLEPQELLSRFLG